MSQYQFSNIEITDEFISANVFKNNIYIVKISAEILHLEYTQDIEDILYQEFRTYALNYLDYGNYHSVSKTSFGNCSVEPDLEDESNLGSNIIKWDFRKKLI